MPPLVSAPGGFVFTNIKDEEIVYQVSLILSCCALEATQDKQNCVANVYSVLFLSAAMLAQAIPRTLLLFPTTRPAHHHSQLRTGPFQMVISKPLSSSCLVVMKSPFTSTTMGQSPTKALLVSPTSRLWRHRLSILLS